jgi:hypothetical protein
MIQYNHMKRLSPIIEALKLPDGEQSKLKEPLKFSQDELTKLTIELIGYPFISFGNALICPKCGVQQGILTNVAPDGEVNFYLNFRCDDYKVMEQEKIDALAATAEAATPPVEPTPPASE